MDNSLLLKKTLHASCSYKLLDATIVQLEIITVLFAATKL